MWFLKNTFGIITLQVGVISFSSVFITLAACILLVNVLSLDMEEPMAWITMFLFIFTMTVIWSIAFIGAYKEQKNLVSTATICWAVYFVLWNAIVIWSFIQQNKNICIGARCPNTLWLINNSWYELKYNANEEVKLNNNKKLKLTGVKRLIEQMKTNNEINIKHNETRGTTENQRSMILSTLLIILYTSIYFILIIFNYLEMLWLNTKPIFYFIQFSVILLYSWMILISYLKEIQHKINPQTQE